MRKAGVAAAAVVLGCVALALAAPAAPATSIAASGTYTVTDFGSIDCLPVGASGFMLRCTTSGFVSVYTGTLTGTTTTDFTQLIDCKTGRMEADGIETFTGSVAGAGTGTLTWLDRFFGTIDCDTFAVGDLRGLGVGLSGTGALAALQGTLSFTATTYSGTLH